MNSIVSWCFIASVSLGLQAKDESKAKSSSDDAVSLELFEYLAEFSEGDGTLIDPQTFETITPKAQVQCKTQPPNSTESLNKTEPLIDTNPTTAQDPVMAALCLRSVDGSRSQKRANNLKPEDDA